MPRTPTKHTPDPEFLNFLKQHQRAWDNPYPGFETAIVHFVKGLLAYNEVYHARYGVSVSQDPALGVNWLDIARGTVGLLDGDTGRLSCAALDGLIRGTAERAGYPLSLEQEDPS